MITEFLVYSKSMALNVNLKLIENKSWLLTDIGKMYKHEIGKSMGTFIELLFQAEKISV